jgi:hypothetical protein
MGNTIGSAFVPHAHHQRRLAVLDRYQRRLHQRARAHGFANLDRYLAARSRKDASLPQMARELGTTVPVLRRLLADAGINRPPQPVLTARHRRRATDQRLAIRASPPRVCDP